MALDCWLVGVVSLLFCFHHEVFSCDHNFIRWGEGKDIFMCFIKFPSIIIHTQIQKCRKCASVTLSDIDLIKDKPDQSRVLSILESSFVPVRQMKSLTFIKCLTEFVPIMGIIRNVFFPF